jgi:hypothetical protein
MEIDPRRKIFVVGNSRSGTHLVSGILGNHARVYTFNELHFFEQLWTPKDVSRHLTRDEGIQLAARLLDINAHGYLRQGKSSSFAAEAQRLLGKISNDELTSVRVYEEFLLHETCRHGKVIPCEHTPRNVLYIGEILGMFPESRVIVMVRDPRDILLSQKRRWRQKFFGANVPITESIRTWINYNPITISQLWNVSLRATDRLAADPRLLYVYFEDVIDHPEQTLTGVCEFLGLDFHPDMLLVPHRGSSSQANEPEKLGIRKRARSWQKGGLTSTEIYLCQKLCGDRMRGHHYEPTPMRLNALTLGYYLLLFILKMPVAFLLNLHRMKSIADTLKRRWR